MPALPDIVRRAGQAAVFAAEEFFYGAIRNEHTRTAYRRAVDRFLGWCEQRGLELARIAPGDVGQYFDGLRKKGLSVATRKQHLAAVRHFFDGQVTRHAIILNPALSVREERYEAVEGKTPEITIEQARRLLKDIPLVKKTKREDGAEEDPENDEREDHPESGAVGVLLLLRVLDRLAAEIDFKIRVLRRLCGGDESTHLCRGKVL